MKLRKFIESKHISQHETISDHPTSVKLFEDKEKKLILLNKCSK